jgi:RNA polymerase sigma-32 factor
MMTTDVMDISAVMRIPMLSREEERDLVLRWTGDGDEDALHVLINAHGRMAIKVARQYRAYGLPVTDIIQEGFIGLLQAGYRFDPDRAVRFSTYAKWWVRAAIQDYILRNWSIVRIGTTAQQKSLFFNMRRLSARLGADGSLTHDMRGTIANDLKVPEKAVENMEGRLSGRDQSTNAVLGEDGDMEWQDRLADAGPTPEDTVGDRHDGQRRSALLKKAMGELSDRERTIIEFRHLGEDKVVLSELGERFGISKERVRQLEQRALGKLRAAVLREARGGMQAVSA